MERESRGNMGRGKGKGGGKYGKRGNVKDGGKGVFFRCVTHHLSTFPLILVHHCPTDIPFAGA